MRRWRARILLLVLIGIVLNLTVAWSCALWWPVDKDWSPSPLAAALPDALADSVEIRDWARAGNLPASDMAFTQGASDGIGIRMESLGMWNMRPGVDSMGPARVRRVVRAGWPMASMGCIGHLDWWMDPRDPAGIPADWRGGVAVPKWMRPSESGPEVFFPGIPRPLPLRIVPVGFVADTTIYTIIVGAVLFGPGVIRRVWRVRRGLCRACAYPISGLAVCPECGRPVEAAGHREAGIAPPA